MSDNLPAKKRSAAQLDTKERVVIAHKLAKDYAKGVPYYKMADEHNITTPAVKKLLEEHATYYRVARPDSKTLQEEAYREFIGRMQEIQERDGVPALVKSTAIQAELGAKTRIDKIMGHELQGDIEGAADTIANLVKRANESGVYDRVSVDDLATVGDEEFIEDAEIVDE